MDPVKEAFNKVKEDINRLRYQLESIFDQIQEIKRTIKKTQTKEIEAEDNGLQTDMHSLEALKTQNLHISIGNGGVPTDRQTDRQTDKLNQKFVQNKEERSIEQIEKVSEILESLDNIKKDLRSKFKALTDQEMSIFSTIYQLEQEEGPVSYQRIAQKLNLSESSIRDYVLKIIKKGIPITKRKVKNKRIELTIPLEFRKIASLQTLLSLRGL